MNRIMKTAVIEDGVEIGENCFIGHNVVIRKDTVIGNNVVIGHNTTIEDCVTLGDEVRIQANCYITRYTKVENKVFIGPGVLTFNDKYICSHGRPEKSKLIAPVIHYGARIGGGSKLLPEVEIGANSFVGCGSLVTRNIPERELWYGFPARKHGYIGKDELI